MVTTFTSNHDLYLDEVLRGISILLEKEYSVKEAPIIKELNAMNDPYGTDWVPLYGPDEEDPACTAFCDEYLRMMDLVEMEHDIDEWEFTEATHEYFANGGSPKGSFPVVVTNTGEKYSQGICGYGKVFIPNVALKYFRSKQQFCLLEFKGFEGARTDEITGRKRITIPWRCLRVE
jgi:hypothetical protein